MATKVIQRWISTRHVELVVLVGGCASIFSLVSLLGWSPGDPTPFHPGTGRVENYCGPIGATLADGLFGLVGYGAWGVGFPAIFGVCSLAGRRVFVFSKWVSGSGFFLCSLVGAQFVFGPGTAYPPGGLIGGVILSSLEVSAGRVGAGIVLAGGTLVTSTYLWEIDWTLIARRAVDSVESTLPVLLDRAGLYARSSFLLATGRAKEGARISRAGVGSLTTVFAAIWRSLFEVGAEDSWNVGISEGIGDSIDIPPSEVREATFVGRPAAYAEVEWDPTQATGVGHVDEDSSKVMDLFPQFSTRSVGTHAEGEALVDVSSGPSVGSCIDSVVLSPVETTKPSISSPSEVLLSLASSPSESGGSVVVQSEAEIPIPQPESRPAETTKASAQMQAVAVHRGVFLDLRVEDDGKSIEKKSGFTLPPLALLDLVPEQHASFDEDELRVLAGVVEHTLCSFKVAGKVVGIRPGPVVTVFEFLPEAGIRVSKIAALSDDLAMSMKATRVRIVAPIPGRGVVGIEIPSATRLSIFLREVLASPAFKASKCLLPCVIGKDTEGAPVVADLAKMPHLLVGGTTGSGKSVGVNGMLMSLLFTRTPDELRLILVDPKMLEFEMYNGIPHLLHPIITEAKKAQSALAWACKEMDERYRVLARWGTRSLEAYNDKVQRELVDWNAKKARQYQVQDAEDGTPAPLPSRLPYIVIVIDELADLMMCGGKDVEESIVRIAQKARACGIHLIVATQRPSVDVVTGLIKANLPTRIAYQLRTKIDSRTILDQGGAETLLGKGDCLYLAPGSGNVERCHGAFVSDGEVSRVTSFLRKQRAPVFINDISSAQEDPEDEDEDELDDLYERAVEVVQKAGKASTSMVQRHLKIGYNRAARIIESMERNGVIGPADGAKAREVY